MANTIGELNVEIGAKLDKLEAGLNRMEQSIGHAGKQSEKTASQSFSKVGGIIAGAFSIQAISSFARAVIEVRSEFEKFEAVLTNTLGSSSAAQLALADIKDMAAMTPFSVAELSGAFVKLTNYGLKPSMEAMRQYGDLASAVGKGFDQLAEAVADATTGEFERLKEFGIKSKKEGDKVTFTFKEQATQVDFTADAIENYITSLGDLEGVSGSMAAISETLGGKVSNLGDRFDSLLNTIGDTSAWGAVIDALGETLSGTEALIKGLQSDIGGVPWYEKMAMLFSTTGAQAQLAVMAAQQDALDKTALKAEVAAEQTDDLTEKTNDLSEAEKLAAFNTASAAFALEKLNDELETYLNRTKEVKFEPIDLGDLAEIGLDEEEGIMDPATASLDRYTAGLAVAADAANLFGGVLQSSFDAALMGGQNFFDVFGKALKQMIAQLAAAAASALVLSTIISVFTGGGIGGTFKKMFFGDPTKGGAAGLAGGFGGLILSGTDLTSAINRTQTTTRRTNG